MQFYMMRHVVPGSYGLVAVDGYQQAYVFLANSLQWHRAPYLDADCFFDGVDYVRLSADEVVSLMPGVRGIVNDGWGWGVLWGLLTLPAGDIVTSDYLGLSVG